jgi:hypothetical protein
MLADGVVGVDLDGDFKTASEKPPSFEESFNSWLKAQGSRLKARTWGPNEEESA